MPVFTGAHRLRAWTKNVTGRARPLPIRCMTHLGLSLRESMAFAALALSLVEQETVLAGLGAQFAGFETRLLLLRCRLAAGEDSYLLVAEVGRFVGELDGSCLLGVADRTWLACAL